MKKQRLLFMFLAALFLCCFVILSLSKIGFAFTLPDTGQTKCYNTQGTEIACAGTGQDGVYVINPMGYTDNGDGTITDNVTGLMWQKREDTTTYNWYKASGTYDATYNPTSQNVCGSLILGGQAGWRLPTKKELATIVDYGIPSTSPSIDTTYFPITKADAYWSSTTSAGYPNTAWYVAFVGGGDNRYVKSYGYRVRCVRSGQSLQSFTDNGNGTVTDNGTGLMWQQGEPGKMTWTNALTYCEGLSLGGQTDWRLPNVKELSSITDDTKNRPAIDTTYFPNIDLNPYGIYQYYWSSTSSTYYPSDAWHVDFGDGNVGPGYGKYTYYDVRCVRGGTRPTSCTYIISPTSQTFTSTGGSGSVTVTASASTCAWTSSSSLSWVTITTGSGTGSGTATFSVSANTTGATRTGNITIAGQPFTIIQAAAPQNNCAATLSGSVLHIPEFTLGSNSYWFDLTYVPTSDGLLWFKLTNAGGN